MDRNTASRPFSGWWKSPEKLDGRERQGRLFTTFPKHRLSSQLCSILLRRSTFEKIKTHAYYCMNFFVCSRKDIIWIQNNIFVLRPDLASCMVLRGKIASSADWPQFSWEKSATIKIVISDSGTAQCWVLTINYWWASFCLPSTRHVSLHCIIP